jgi:lipopolysaccharide export system permease protein
MPRIAWIISRYLAFTVLPYFASAWVLLSVILFVQQGTRYSEIFFSINIPANLVWQLTVALIPNVVAFTCPMAMLVGTIIGLTKMQGDSELIAIRAAGIGRLQIALPIMALGVVMSAFAFVVNLKGVPLAAGLVRSVALQSAIKKLESPIEPGVFNTEVAGYTIYVKGGDFETSTWKNIFIYQEDKPNGVVRLITSRNGRIDTSGQESEMVLEKATVSTLPLTPGTGKYVSENIDGVRLAIKTRRGDLLQRLSNTETHPEELGLEQLAAYAKTKEGSERTEAQLLWQRRILLSVSPFIFCVLGSLVVLRFNRGGRGFGMLMALIILIGFFLLAFLGEQLARVGTISVGLSSLLPITGSVAAVLLLSFTSIPDRIRALSGVLTQRIPDISLRRPRLPLGNLFVDLTTGLRDFDLVRNLIKNFLLTLFFLVAIFVIFTAFEMWKFAGAFEGGVTLLARYLGYLMPFVYLQVAPSAAMIATLATYVIKSRNNEIVTWTSAGQSVYRLLLPCIVLTVLLGGVNWWIQESLMPGANRLQDQTRSVIRNRGVPATQAGKNWVATDRRIYSFDLDEGAGRPDRQVMNVRTAASDNGNRIARQRFGGRWQEYVRGERERDGFAFENEASLNPNGRVISASWSSRSNRGPALSADRESYSDTYRPKSDAGTGFAANTAFASDNVKRVASSPRTVRNLTIYEFADNGENLQFIYRSSEAEWMNGRIRFVGPVERSELRDGKIQFRTQEGGELAESLNPFAGVGSKPAHLGTRELEMQLDSVESDADRRSISVLMAKRYTTPFLPLVIALFTAPFALSLSRKGKAATVGYAVVLWLLFTGTSSVFEQFGVNGSLPANLAVWSPLAIFSFLGVYLLSRVRT